MPELPDVTAYLDGLNRFIGGERLERVHVRSPFDRSLSRLLKSDWPKQAESQSRTGLRLETKGRMMVG